MNHRGELYDVTAASFWILTRPRFIGPPCGGLWKATPGSQTRSNHPFSIAGIPYHQVGKHKTSASALRNLSTYVLTPVRLAAGSKYTSRSLDVRTGSKRSAYRSRSSI